MKSIISILATMAVAILSVACADDVQREADYLLKQNFRYVKDKPLVDARLVREVPNTENYNATSITVFDSLGVVENWSIGGAEHVFNLININTGEEYGSFCPVGRGPREFERMYGNHDFVKQNGDVKLYVCGRDSVFMCNVSQSLKSGITTYECSMLKPYHNYKEKDKKTGEMIDRERFVNPISYLDSDRVFCMIDSYGRRGEVPDEYKSMFDGIAANQTLQIMPQYFIYSLRVENLMFLGRAK